MVGRPLAPLVTSRPLALVTGATSGIGREFAVDYARRGHDLVLVARRRDVLESTAKELTERFGVSCAVCVADLSSIDGVEAMLRHESLVRTPDVMVANAGVTLAARVGTSSSETIEDVVTLLATGAILVIERLAPAMAERGSGDIIVVSSIAAKIPMPKSAVYAAAKAAVTSYARSVHRELRDSGVRVVTVNPGYVHTDLHRAAGLEHLERVVPGWLWLEPIDVVKAAHRALERGRDSVTPGFIYRLSQPFLSSDAAQKLWRRVVRPGRIRK